MTVRHTPDSPLHPDAFRHMMGTVRTGSNGLAYKVTRIRFKGSTRFARAAVIVEGTVIVNQTGILGLGSTTLGGYASESFHTNP